LKFRYRWLKASVCKLKLLYFPNKDPVHPYLEMKVSCYLFYSAQLTTFLVQYQRSHNWWLKENWNWRWKVYVSIVSSFFKCCKNCACLSLAWHSLSVAVLYSTEDWVKKSMEKSSVSSSKDTSSESQEVTTNRASKWSRESWPTTELASSSEIVSTWLYFPFCNCLRQNQN